MKKHQGYEIIANNGFFDIFENPDIVDVQNHTKCAKIDENSKFKKKIENLIRELPFGIGFIGIHELARFLQHFEIW